MTRPLRSQSPYLVGSGPAGPPTSPVIGFTPPGCFFKGSFSAYGCVPSNCSNLPMGVFSRNLLVAKKNSSNQSIYVVW